MCSLKLLYATQSSILTYVTALLTMLFVTLPTIVCWLWSVVIHSWHGTHSTPSLSPSWQRPADLILGHRIQVTKKVECQPERKRRTRMQWDWQRRRDQRGRPQRQQQQWPPPKRGRRPTVRWQRRQRPNKGPCPWPVERTLPSCLLCTSSRCPPYVLYGALTLLPQAHPSSLLYLVS